MGRPLRKLGENEEAAALGGPQIKLVKPWSQLGEPAGMDTEPAVFLMIR